MVKILSKIFIIFLSVAFASCNTRTKVEPCDFSYVVSCSSYYSDQEDFQACLETLGGASCSLSAEEINEVNASLASDITSYTCSSANPYVAALIDEGQSVTHTPDLNSGQHYYYVDSFHSFLSEYEDFEVTYAISTAIELAKAGDVIVVCPGEYLENLDIAGEEKDHITLLNIAGGTKEMAEHTQISGEFGGTVVKISGSLGVAIKGFTIKNGSASLLTDNSQGGGIFISNFREFTNEDNHIHIQNSFVEDNVAFANGGGLFVEGLAKVTLQNVSFLRNVATFGSGGALAVVGNVGQTKTVVCEGCVFSQNQSYFSGSALSITGDDIVILQNSDVTLNSGLSDVSFAAVALYNEGIFYSDNTNWGEGGIENLHPDIMLMVEFEEEVSSASEELTQRLETGQVTPEDIENLYADFLTDEGLLPGQYDYSGLTSVACYYGIFTNRCGEIQQTSQ